MRFLITMLGVCAGIVLAVVVIFFIVCLKIENEVGRSSWQLTKMLFKHFIRSINNAGAEEYSREKNVKGMTAILEEEILRDFPGFNKDLIFTICESNLRKIFNSIESLDMTTINDDDEFIYLKENIREQIEDMKSNNIYEKFDDIKFNRHAIMAYTKKQGKATIKISTTLSYYYKTNRKNIKTYENIRKQTRYTSEFVYVYDERKFSQKQVTFSVLCPNCGAPLRGIDSTFCEYCGNHVEKINLKIWKMSSYKEDYK